MEQIQELQADLEETPIVLLLGPPKVGLTTAARDIADGQDQDYFDLTLSAGRDHAALRMSLGRVAILDQIQKARDLIDLVGEFAGAGGRAVLTAHYVPDGIALLRGRVTVSEILPIQVSDISESDLDLLFERGGFPASFSALSQPVSLLWRQKYLEETVAGLIAELGPRGAVLRAVQLLQCVAAGQGASLNISQTAQMLDVDNKTVLADLELLEDLFLVRSLDPVQLATAKRLVKRKRYYVRDSGLCHCLGRSDWVGFALEQVANSLPNDCRLGFYKASGGAEAQLVFEGQGRRGAIYISETGRQSRGFASACDDMGITDRFLVSRTGKMQPLADAVLAVRDMFQR